jgi:two-component system sensor kinase FixL
VTSTDGKRTAQLAAILEHAVDAIITMDERGIVLSVNPDTSTLFGYRDDEVVGQNINMLMPAPYQSEHDGYLDNYLRTGERQIIGIGREVVGRRKDGTTFPMHLAVSETTVEEIRFFTGVVRDISDLKEKQARLEAILDNAVDAIITIDHKGIVESVNPATQRVFGYDPTEIVGNNVKMLMPFPYSDEHDGYLANYHRTGERKIIGIGREVVGRRKDGTTFPMHLAVSEIKIGHRTLFTGIVRDITDLKEAERRMALMNQELEQRIKKRTAQLEEAQSRLVEKERLATLGQVSGGIAHEIRNPLNTVKTSAYFLLNAKDPKPEKTKEHLERIDRQVALIDNVVTALSDVAKLPQPNLIPLSVRACVQQAATVTSFPDNIRVAFDIADDIPNALADENQILIAFRNLFRNAREAMPDGGEISIVSRADGGQVRIAVTDTGTGITREHIERVMEPLFSTKAYGIGLGLAITKTIVEKNRGELAVVSELGTGSTFTVTLTSDQTI